MENRLVQNEYQKALCALGEASLTAKDMADVEAVYDALRQWENTPFTHTQQALMLMPWESAVLACCVHLVQKGEDLPASRWLVERCNGLGGDGPVSSMFSPRGREFLSLAVDYLWYGNFSLPTYMELYRQGNPLEESFHSEKILQEMGECLAGLRREGVGERRWALALTGETGTGKMFLMKTLAKIEGFSLLTVHGEQISEGQVVTIMELGRLLEAMVCIKNYSKANEGLLERLYDQYQVVFLTARHLAGPQCVEGLLERTLPPLGLAERLNVMKGLFSGVDANSLEKAAGLSKRSIGQLKQAAARYAGERMAQPNVEPSILMAAALRGEDGLALGKKAQLLKSQARLADLYLPKAQKERLAELCQVARVRRRVWSQWEMGGKLPYGQGVSALFYGASGTGKTMAATVVANELELDLYRVDLSQLISKYVGETQKNLGDVFDAAAECDCILFFDEADALFSRRSEGADAQDRYANAEIAYLLQRTESHDGVILLATNLLQNFDEAFRRRIGYMLHFPQPDAPLREQLWRGVFSEAAPLAPDVDLHLLARELELSGASIKAAAIHGACVAASEGGPITMGHIVAGARLEYQKLGRTFPSQWAAMFPV